MKLKATRRFLLTRPERANSGRFINIIDTYDGDMLELKLIEHKHNVELREIDKFITEEVYKCIFFSIVETK